MALPLRCLVVLLALTYQTAWEAEAVEYWTLDLSQQNLKCERIAGPLAHLQTVFENSHGAKCVMSDEQDHFLFRCGEIPQVVVPTREGCLMWTKQKLSEEETLKEVMFKGCLAKARTRSPVEVAIPYCRCVSTIAAFETSEKALEAMGPEERVRLMSGLGQRCEKTMGAAAPAWKKIETAAFSVWMPGSPTKETQTLPSEVGDIKLSTWSLIEQETALVFSVVDYPRNRMSKALPQDVLDGARSGALANVNGTVTREIQVLLDTGKGRFWPGRQFEASLPQGFRYTARMYLVGDRLYQFALVAKDATTGRIYFERMVKDFRLKSAAR